MPTSIMELQLFYNLMEHNYLAKSSEFTVISRVDIKCFQERMTNLSNEGIECSNEGIECSNAGIECDKLYDPIIEPLVQSSLASYLYMKKYSSAQQLFHPNYMRFKFMDDLIANKASVTLGAFTLYELSPSTASMDRDKLMLKVDSLLLNPILRILVDSFVKKLQVDGNPEDRITGAVNTQRKPTRGMGLLYFILMDLYLEHLDSFIYETINQARLNCFWARCLDSAILGFTDKKAVLEFNEMLKMPIVLTAWGLMAKVRSGSKGGKILRPWNGKLYINIEGQLQWERPESIIKM